MARKTSDPTLTRNRELWLLRATARLAPLIASHGHALPERLSVSVGFSRAKKAIGSCWSKSATEDGTVHVYICPTLGEATRVLDVLLHELVHAAVGTECGHRGEFRRVARAVGLVGPITATSAGEALRAQLEALARELGDYPHSPLRGLASRSWRSGSTKRLVLRSPQDNSYWVYMDREMFELHGAPTDPWGNQLAPTRPAKGG